MEKTLFAGFWLRFVAFCIDVLLINTIGWILGFIVGFAYVSVIGSTDNVEWVGDIFGILMNWLYFAGFESSKFQGTFGKRIFGIKVTDEEGKRISFGRATGRHFAKLISVIIGGIGYIMIFFTKKKQALHDLIASTLVIKKA